MAFNCYLTRPKVKTFQKWGDNYEFHLSIKTFDEAYIIVTINDNFDETWKKVTIHDTFNEVNITDTVQGTLAYVAGTSAIEMCLFRHWVIVSLE